ncbi:MAG: DUF3991 and toprim domain-containing protein [Eubacteriales bacterium]|nr:DUF3991 and toprim domain-containing protein [Eubacteriales bacterium]
MPGVTREQIDRAKQWDLLSYLQTYEPGELKKAGPHEYCTVTHDSLKISNGKWHWTARGFGGKTALDYLIKVRDMPFVEAVRTLCGESAPILSQPVTRPPEQPRAFALPEASRCATAAVSYLQRRGIDSEIISRCIQAGMFFESRKYHNCVFVGRDKAGKARFACLRGTVGDFKGDVPGSDKRFNFCFPANGPSRTVAVFESAIDALSLATLFKARGAATWDRGHYLSLGGTSPLALLQFLHDRPEIDRVYLCLDNDKAGLDGMARIEAALRDDKELQGRSFTVERKPPPVEHGKDYNELLRATLAGRPAPARGPKERSI